MGKKTGGDSTSLAETSTAEVELSYERIKRLSAGKKDVEKELEALGDITYGFGKWEKLDDGARQRILEFLSHRYNFDYYLNVERKKDEQG